MDYLKKKDFGKVPRYIERIKRSVQREQARRAKQAQDAEAARNATKRTLTTEERAQLLVGLKARWESVNNEYQKITHMTNLDTLCKVRRKENFESELNQIEKDMDLLGRKEEIIISLES